MRTTKFRAMALATAALMAMAPALAQAAQFGQKAPQAANAANPFRGIPVTGTINGQAVSGATLDIYSFKATGGTDAKTLQAIGVLHANGENIPVAIPVTGGGSGAGGAGANGLTTRNPSSAQFGSCDILNLVLGPLHLDVLGLVIDLNQVVLNIDAQQGPGNLLGNLLCAVTGLLDGLDLGGLLSDIFAAILEGLLNQILAGLP